MGAGYASKLCPLCASKHVNRRTTSDNGVKIRSEIIYISHRCHSQAVSDTDGKVAGTYMNKDGLLACQ